MKMTLPHKKPAYSSRGVFAFVLAWDILFVVLCLHFLHEDIGAKNAAATVIQAVAAVLWTYFTYADVHRWYLPKKKSGE